MLDEKIKVAYIVTPITFGGAEKVSLNFLHSVDRSRFDIRPILLVRPWESETYFARELRRIGYSYETIPVALKDKGDIARVIRVVWRLYVTLKNGMFKMVHTHGYFADICGLPVARVLGLKRLSTCHGFINANLKMNFYNYIDKTAIKLCNSVIAVSDGIRNNLVSSGLKASRIQIIENAVVIPHGDGEKEEKRCEKRQSMGISQNEVVVGFFGRLSTEKGVKFLIESISELVNSAVPVKLLIVGEGSERESLGSLAKVKSIEDAVMFVGFQPDIANWMPICDVFLLPSLTDGTPLALLEAMSMGIPVVASAVGGVPKVINDGVNGLLVNPGDAEGIRDAILKVMANSDLKDKMIQEGLTTIREKYDVEKWSRKIEGVYEDIIS